MRGYWFHGADDDDELGAGCPECPGHTGNENLSRDECRAVFA